MDGDAHQKPRERKVANQKAGWKVLLLLILCLLQGSSLSPAHGGPHLRWLLDGSLPSRTPSSPLCWRESSLAVANALKGPRLVSGKPGGAVTIQCHYAPSSVNRRQRKYWCRLGPPRWTCRTIVSSSRYTHYRYHGRVALADFPQRGFFVVRLSQLSLDDVGCYHCGIGDGSTMLFFSMNLTVSAGPSSSLPTATPAAGDLPPRPSETASPAADRWTPGLTQTTEGRGTGWDRGAPTPGASTATASAKGRQTPGTTGTAAPGTGVWVEASVTATVPVPESPASNTSSLSNTTDGVWMWRTRSSMTNRAIVSKDRREMTTTQADRPRVETERARISVDVARKVIGTSRPPALVSEKLPWEIPQETTPVSKQPFLGWTEGTTPAAGVWTLGATSIETASVEGSTEGDLDAAAGDSGPQATPSQAPAAGPLRPPGKESSVKSSGGRKSTTGHPDSDDTFPGAKSPSRPAAPRGKEDAPGWLSCCPSQPDCPGERPGAPRNGKINHPVTTEGGPGPKTSKTPSLFSASFLHLHEEELRQLELHPGKQRLTMLGPKMLKHCPWPKAAV
nr:high affinity immunoglobulin alpha and immunoglobulin mu Fc receptor isoform X1 [Microcebus murinus]XP_020139962.1 high affinity immunoglobulin alpha and immunoglobulin mu Fc receptor isoform X1 [Microcebus murinus]